MRRRLAAGAGAVLLTVAGCGGGGSGSSEHLSRAGRPVCLGGGALPCRLVSARAGVVMRLPRSWKAHPHSDGVRFVVADGSCRVGSRRRAGAPPRDLDALIRRARAAANEGGPSDTYGLIRIGRERAGGRTGVGQVIFRGGTVEHSVVFYLRGRDVTLRCDIARDAFERFDAAQFEPVRGSLRFSR